MVELLEVYLSDISVGQLTLLSGDRSFFAFNDSYLNDANSPVLSQSFFTQSGGLVPETKTTQTKLPPFFSNLLPEGHLRSYLAAKGGVKASREFKLIELLGADLPGAVIVKPLFEGGVFQGEIIDEAKSLDDVPYRFSLAGVQLKFSALAESTGGLTIPASGVGGNWIIKLPAQNFVHVPENEWAMLHLAAAIGIPVPETRLIDLGEVNGLPNLGVLSGTKALAIKRFDRGAQGERIHIENFAQVYGLFPADKYSKVSYTNIANMIWTLTGEVGIVDFIKRLVFSILIGNGDMHLKNWSLIYADGRTPQLTPAYDYVSTIPYIPNDRLALNLSGTKDMGAIKLAHFQTLAVKAKLPEFLVIKTVKETFEAVQFTWNQNQHQYALPDAIANRITQHLMGVKII